MVPLLKRGGETDGNGKLLRFMAEACCTLLKSVPVKSDQGNTVGNYVVDSNMYS